MFVQNWKVRFFTVWVGQAFSLVGSALVRFALIWWLTEETGSATVLATASLVSTLPFIFVGPLVGALVDRWKRRWVMIVSDGLIALFTAVLAYLYWVGSAQLWHVYVILFLRSLGGTLQEPAMRASTSLMVPKDQLARVGGMNETLQGVVSIVSPPLGALLLEILDMQGTLAIDLITALMAIGPLLFLRIPQPGASDVSGERNSIFRDLGEGFRYVWNWRGLFFMFLVLAGLRFFMAPSFSMLPLMVTQYFGGAALELAWINSAHGGGFIAGGFILSVWGGFKRRTMTALVGLIGVGVGMLVFGSVPADAFWLALIVMFLRTTMLPLIRGPVLAIFQAHVPPEMQGRVFTLLMSSISVMAPLGLAVGGPLADAFGVRALFLISGAGCLLTALLWASNPTLMRLEDQARQQALDAEGGAALGD
jgi:DHA3 family macrolide efflux protein-like MFS transporter